MDNQLRVLFDYLNLPITLIRALLWNKEQIQRAKTNLDKVNNFRTNTIPFKCLKWIVTYKSNKQP